MWLNDVMAQEVEQVFFMRVNCQVEQIILKDLHIAFY